MFWTRWGGLRSRAARWETRGPSQAASSHRMGSTLLLAVRGYES